MKHFYATCAMLALLISGCTSDVGSDRWCAALSNKPKANWSEGDAADYTRHCIAEK